MNIVSFSKCPFSAAHFEAPTAVPSESYHRFLDMYFSPEGMGRCGQECGQHICALMHFFEPEQAGGADKCTRCQNHFLRAKIDKFVKFVKENDAPQAVMFARQIGDPEHAEGAVEAAQQFILWAGILERVGDTF